MASAQVQESSNYLSDFQSFMNSISVTSSQNAQCTDSGGNSLNLTTGRNCEFLLDGGTLNVTQVSNASCQQIVNQNLDVDSEVKANINRHIGQYLAQNQSSKQGWLTLALNAQVQGASNTTEIVTKIQNSVNEVNSQVCQNTVTSYNAANLDLCGVYDNNAVINIGQNSIAGAYQSCTMDVIVKAFQRDQILTQVAQRVNQEQKSLQEGIGSLFKWLVVIAAIIGVVVIIGIIMYAAFGGFSSKPDDSKKKGGISEQELLSLASSKGKDGGGSSMLPLLLAEEGGGLGGSK